MNANSEFCTIVLERHEGEKCTDDKVGNQHGRYAIRRDLGIHQMEQGKGQGIENNENNGMSREVTEHLQEVTAREQALR